MTDFSGRVALVTGASGGLGSVLVARLLEAGATVAAVDRSADRELPVPSGATGRLSRHAAELADPAAVGTLVADVADRHGTIDHVFNVAGAFAAEGTVEDTALATWRRLLDANFQSTLLVCRAVVPLMKAKGGGTVVNVASRAALAADAGVAAYSVAKTAVLRLTEALAAEGKRQGVRVNCILPGTIDTPANRAAMPAADRTSWVEPAALVDVMLFLSGPGARAVHGAALPVFGLG